MLGTLANTGAIIAGCLLGILLKGGIPERVNDTIMNGLALFVVYIGVDGALKAHDPMAVVLSVVIGAVIGELIDIDRRLQIFGDNIERSFKGKGGRISEAFVTSSLIFCVGAMAIVGSLESGLTGNHQKLFTKSIIDGVASVVFTSSLGIGVVLSSVSVLIYQGLITLAASSVKEILVTSVINDMTAVGSLLIIGISFNMLGMTKVKVANLLPGVFIPIVYHLIYPYIGYAYQILFK